MSRPFDTRPGGRLDAAFRQAPDLTEADVKATLMPSPQSCRSCRWSVKDARFLYVSCEWPVVMTIPLPDCLSRSAMRPDGGTTCPTWEQRAPDTESRS